MGTPRELVDAGQVGAALALVSLLGLLLAWMLGFQWRQRRHPGLLRAALVSAAAALAYPLWLIYNAVVGWLGLDSVAALLINLVLFIAAGVAGGLLFRRLWPAADATPEHPNT